jgi:hypothetical protein
MKHKPTVPTPPEAWLVVRQGMVIGAFPSRNDPALSALVKEEKSAGRRVSVLLDHPSLNVNHYGISIENSSWLTARDNWFERYQNVLEPHLRDPRIAQVYTLAPGRLTDPLATHKSSSQGPFPLPRGTDWPTCGFCDCPMGFLGVLDFRDYSAVPVPRGSLVLHVCTECCGSVVADREAWSLTWIKEGDEIEIMGDVNNEVLVGTRWEATEYAFPGCYKAGDLATTGPFLHEHSIYFSFSCLADKVGGHVFWIQSEDRLFDENSFVSKDGESMTYIGQFVGSPDIEIGDGGIAYLLYSPRTGNTIMYPQGF